MGSYYSNDCGPGLKPAPYRIVRMYHGWLGWIAFFWQFVVAIVISCLFIGSINTQPFLLPGFLIASIIVYVIFMLINIFYFGPYNFTRPVPSIGVCNPPKSVTYNRKIARDLCFHSDEWHFRIGLLGSAFVLLFLAIFLGQNGLNTFQPLPAIFVNTDVMNYAIVKGFQIATIGLAGILMVVFFASQSDFLYRTLTAMNDQFGESSGGELPLRAKGNTEFF